MHGKKTGVLSQRQDFCKVDDDDDDEDEDFCLSSLGKGQTGNEIAHQMIHGTMHKQVNFI